MTVLLLLSLLGLVAHSSAVSPEGQYTPNQAAWETLNDKPLASDKISAHDPDEVSWIDWSEDKYKWDGKTTYSPTKLTKVEFAEAVCPHVDAIRGIREVFYKNNPFADNANPTKAEVDEWHRIAINHLRALVGYTTDDRLAKKDYCMFARSLWGQQRKRSDFWDAEYPDGVCGEGSTAHCGASFIPSDEDQIPYLPKDYPSCQTQQGAEGIFSGPKSNIPWSVKWSRSICNTLYSEGFFGGHAGPFFHREKFGFSFWDMDTDENNSGAVLRAKWTGKLRESLYCDPSKSGCDPDDDNNDNDNDNDESSAGIFAPSLLLVASLLAIQALI